MTVDSLPPFPVDDQTLDLLWQALHPDGRIAEAKRRLFARIIASAARLDTPFTDEPDLSPWELIKHDMTALDNALKEADGG